jgi:hypothetical protein
MSNQERFATIKAKIAELNKQEHLLKEELKPIATELLAELSSDLTKACDEYYDFCVEDGNYYVVGYEDLNAMDEEASAFDDCDRDISVNYYYSGDEYLEGHKPHVEKLSEIQNSILSIAGLLSLSLSLDYGKLRGGYGQHEYWDFGETTWDGTSWYNSNC